MTVESLPIPGAASVMPPPKDTRELCQTLSGRFSYLAGVAGQTQVAMMANTPEGKVPEWLGKAADAYTGQIRLVGRKALELPGHIGAIKKALDDWNDGLREALDLIKRLHNRYDEALNSRRNSLAALHDDWEAWSRPPNVFAQQAEEKRINDAWESQKTAILAEYKTLMETLGEFALAIARNLRGAMNAWVPAEVAAKGRAAVGSVLFDNVPVVDMQASWAYARAVAPRIASVMKTSNPTDSLIRFFEAEHVGIMDDPYVAAALAEEISPTEIVGFATRLRGRAGNTTMRSLGALLVMSTGGLNLSKKGESTSFNLAKRFLRTKDGKPIKVAFERMSSDFRSLRYIVFDEDGSTQVTKSRENRHESGSSGYHLALQLMGEAAKENPKLALGPEFFEETGRESPYGGVEYRSTAMDILRWEKEHPEFGRGNPLSAGSYPFPTSPAKGYTGSFDLFPGTKTVTDPLQAMYLLMDRPEGTESVPEGSSLAEAEHVRIGAVRRFLGRDTGFDVPMGEGEKNARPINVARYLTGHRLNPTRDYLGFVDSGEAFGKVIYETSRFEKLPPEPIRTSFADDQSYTQAHQEWENYRDETWAPRQRDVARVTAGFINGYQDGLDAKDEGLGVSERKLGGQDQFGYHNSKLRSWAGVILAPYVDNMAESFDSPYLSHGTVEMSTVSRAKGETPIVIFDAAFKDKLAGSNGLLLDLAFDNPKLLSEGPTNSPFDDIYEGGRRPAIQNLRLIATGGFEDDIRQAIRSGGKLEEVVSKWAPLTNSLYVARSDASIAAATALDEQNRQWQERVSAMVRAVPLGDGLTKNVLLDYVSSQVKEQGLDPVLEQLAPTDNAGKLEAKPIEISKTAEESMKQTILRAFYAEGNLTEGDNSAHNYCQGLKKEERFTESDGDLVSFNQLSKKQINALEAFLKEKHPSYDAVSAAVEEQLSDARQANEEAKKVTKPR